MRYCASLGKESPPYRLLQEYYQGTTAELIINLRRRPYIRSSLADKIRGLREGRTSKTENSASKYVYGTGQYTKFILLEDVIKILKSEGKKNEAQILQELREQFAQDQDQAFEVYQQRLAAIKKEPQQKTLKNHSFELRNIFPLFGFSSDNRSPSIPEIIISLFESNKIFPIKVLVGKGAKRTKYSRRVNLEMIINLFKKLNCEDQAFRIAKVENLILEGELGLEDIPDQLRMIARANPCLGSKDTASILGYSVSHLPAIANQYKLNGKGLASISWTAGDGQRANKKYLLDDILIYLDETLGLRALAYTLKAKRNEFVNEQGLVDSAKLSKITEEAKASLDHKP